jgi:hypothetical protein
LQQEAILHVVAKHLYKTLAAHPFRGKKLNDPLVSNALDEMAATANNNKELIQCINPSSLSEELNPLQLLDMFKKVSKHTTNPFAIQLSQSICSPIFRCCVAGNDVARFQLKRFDCDPYFCPASLYIVSVHGGI